MPYIAQREFTLMGGRYGPQGNRQQLPSEIPTEVIDQAPRRIIQALMARAYLKHSDRPVRRVRTRPAKPATPAGLQNLGFGWYQTPDGKRHHGRAAALAALAALKEG